MKEHTYTVPICIRKTYTCTAYTEPEYQRVTMLLAYTGGSTDSTTYQHHQRPLPPLILEGE